jgi:hypothetical protein
LSVISLSGVEGDGEVPGFSFSTGSPQETAKMVDTNMLFEI